LCEATFKGRRECLGLGMDKERLSLRRWSAAEERAAVPMGSRGTVYGRGLAGFDVEREIKEVV